MKKTLGIVVAFLFAGALIFSHSTPAPTPVAGGIKLPEVPSVPSVPLLIYPNPKLTPGAIDPKMTKATVCDPAHRTSDTRDTQSTASQKAKTYDTYGIPHPKNNVGQNQMCELDHLISLELGGADSLDNIWPECGPYDVSLNDRYFKKKDKVENTLHREVCAGDVTLQQAQHIISTDWLTCYNSLQAGAKCL